MTLGSELLPSTKQMTTNTEESVGKEEPFLTHW